MSQQSPPSSSTKDWNQLLRHSSAINIVKPDLISKVYTSSTHALFFDPISHASCLTSSQSIHNPRLVRAAHRPDGIFYFITDGTRTLLRPFGLVTVDVRRHYPGVNKQDSINVGDEKLPRCSP